MTLGEICEQFQVRVDELDFGEGDHAAHLRRLTLKFARDAAEHAADHAIGEIPALIQRCHEVLVALAAEGADLDDRRGRYRSRVTIINLLLLCDGIARLHIIRRPKAADVAELRDLVADALGGLVEPAT